MQEMAASDERNQPETSPTSIVVSMDAQQPCDELFDASGGYTTMPLSGEDVVPFQHNANLPQSPLPLSANSGCWPPMYQGALDLSINWLPSNNALELDYDSILAMSPAGAGPTGPTISNQPIDVGGSADSFLTPFQAIESTSLPVFTPEFICNSNLSSASPASSQATRGELYATSADGAREPCTIRSRRYEPLPLLQNGQHLRSVESDPTIDSEMGQSLQFPDLSHLRIPAASPILSTWSVSDATYNTIYNYFTRTCLESTHFQNYSSTAFPPLTLFNVFIGLYFTHFDPIFPIIHLGSQTLEGSWLLVTAIAAIGSHFGKTQESNACIVPFHEFLRRATQMKLEEPLEPLDIPTAQALILNQIGLTYYGSRMLHTLALSRQGALLNIIESHTPSTVNRKVNEDHGPEQWSNWVFCETWRRIYYSAWVRKPLDLEMKTILTLRPQTSCWIV
jgi:hypothetical protein